MNPQIETGELIETLKAAGEDHEFYPTTGEIIARLLRDLREYVPDGLNRWDWHPSSVLDIGAGNGKVLEALKNARVPNSRRQDDEGTFSEFYAIEKSPILCGQLPESVYVIGTAFEEQSLLSKAVDVIFSNPPYSCFCEWSEKIIRESAAPLVYLVIPERWEERESIKAALRFRGAKAKKLGEFDFLNSEDRQARAKVHLLRIAIPSKKNDAFEAFFDSEFAEMKARWDARPLDEDGEPAERSRKENFASLVVGHNYPEAMVGLYQAEMGKLQRNYQAVASLDVELMREFAISPTSICDRLKKRLSDLRLAYWQELFSKLDTITNRLTNASRKSLLETLQKHVHVDFTVSNIQVVVVWAIRNANRFIDSQLLAVYENMVDSANVVCYKSNQRVFKKDGWRYLQERDGWTHYALDYRIVCQSVGGICRSQYSSSWHNNLEERAFTFLQDLLTVANNLGFICETSPAPYLKGGACQWRSNEGVSFTYKDGKGRECELFQARAFQNQNLHLKLAKKFILALNVEHGRLRGWLRDAAEAVTELQDPTAGQFFACTQKLLPDAGFAKLGAPALRETEPAPAASAPVRTRVKAEAVIAGSARLELVTAFARCAPEFKARLARVAEVAQMAVVEVYALWREYSDRCGDQSAIVSEFVEWYNAKLGGDRQALEAAERGEHPAPSWAEVGRALVEAAKPDCLKVEALPVVVACPAAPAGDLFELVA